MEDSLAVPQKAKHSITIALSNSTPVYIPKRVKDRDLNISVHSSTSHNSQSWKQPKCPSADEWVNKMWYIHIMEYCSAVKQNEVLTRATTWMNLETSMLNEISQTQKDKFCVIPLI